MLRQAATSKIITAAHKINKGVMPDLQSAKEGADFYFVNAAEPEAAVPLIVDLAQKTRVPQALGFDPVKGHPGALPHEPRHRGIAPPEHQVRAALDPAGDKKVERFGWTFAPGDKVMQIRNRL